MELLLLSLLSKIFTSCHFVVGICRMIVFLFSVCVVPSFTYDTCFAIKYASYVEVCITIHKSSRCKWVFTSCFLAICFKVVFISFFNLQIFLQTNICFYLNVWRLFLFILEMLNITWKIRKDHLNFKNLKIKVWVFIVFNHEKWNYRMQDIESTILVLSFVAISICLYRIRNRAWFA